MAYRVYKYSYQVSLTLQVGIENGASSFREITGTQFCRGNKGLVDGLNGDLDSGLRSPRSSTGRGLRFRGVLFLGFPE